MLGLSKHFFVSFFLATCVTFGVANKVIAQVADQDGDGFTDEQEQILFRTDPNKIDTDGDGHLDKFEIEHGYSPLHATPTKLGSLDSDNDGAPDAWEIKIGSLPFHPDTDGDGYTDSTEITNGYSPNDVAPKRIEKKITVSLADQHLAYFFGEAKLEDFAISSGLRWSPTPTGEFDVLAKVPTKHYGGQGYSFYYPNTKWNLHFTTQRLRYYIHGAYWHTNFGKPMSSGCVNVAYANMERLYNFAQVGTKITIQ